MAESDPTIYHNRGIFINHKTNPRIPVINGQLVKSVNINGNSIIQDRASNDPLLFKAESSDLELNVTETHGKYSSGTETLEGETWNYLQLVLSEIGIENNYHRVFIPYHIILKADPDNHNVGNNYIDFFKHSSIGLQIMHYQNNTYAKSSGGAEFTADFISVQVIWSQSEKKYKIEYSYTFNNTKTILATYDLPLKYLIGIGGIYDRPFITFNTIDNDPVFKYYFKIEAIQVSERKD